MSAHDDAAYIRNIEIMLGALLFIPLAFTTDPVNGPTLSLSLLSSRHLSVSPSLHPRTGSTDSLGGIENLGDWSLALFLSRSFFLAISPALACVKDDFVFEILTAVSGNTVVFWEVRTCRLINGYPRSILQSMFCLR
jgi:hypothetical protein